VRGFVANADFAGFEFLAARQPLEGVNFSQLSGGDYPDPALLRWHNEQVFEQGAA
jgi:hypothetical protein